METTKKEEVRGGIRSEEVIVAIPIGMLAFGVPATLAGLDGIAFGAIAIAGGIIFFALNIYFQHFRH